MLKKNVKTRNVLFLPFAFQPEFHIGIARYAGRHGWHLNADMARTGKIPYGWHGDGIITLLTEDDTAGRIVQRYGVPVVDLSVIRADMPIARVAKDNAAIGRLGARHFLEQGWHSFVFFSREDNRVCRLRIEGFQQELARHGLACSELMWPLYNREGAERWDLMGRWLLQELGRLPKPVAVMTYNDYDAAVVMDACLAAGLEIPGDVGVLGVDNIIEVCPCLPVPLSSVQTEAVMVGFQAAALLDRLLDGAPLPERPILIQPSGIARRESTDRLVIRDARLARAIAFIEAQLGRPFSMIELAEAAGLSRQGLYNIFDRELHQTPIEYILRQRLRLARELLAGTAESVGAISERCGMPVLSTFIRHFHHETGQTPGEWRRSLKHASGPDEPVALHAMTGGR